MIRLDHSYGVRATLGRDEAEELVSLLPDCQYRDELRRRLDEIGKLVTVTEIMEL